MSTERTRRIHCDAPGCAAYIGGYDLKAYELQRLATIAGWSIGSGSRRGVDRCPMHVTNGARRLTEPAP